MARLGKALQLAVGDAGLAVGRLVEANQWVLEKKKSF